MLLLWTMLVTWEEILDCTVYKNNNEESKGVAWNLIHVKALNIHTLL